MEDNVTPSTMEGIKMVEKQWGKLCLSEEKQISIIVGEEVSEVDSIKERKSLVGRICTKKNISREAI